MPKKAGLTQEEKDKQFEQWKESDEYKSILNWLEVRVKDDDIDKLDNAYKDITQDWQPIMDATFNMCEKMKVPGRKAKSYEQSVIRTMFFERAEIIKIDGKPYEISNNANIDHFNCKLFLCSMWQVQFEQSNIEGLDSGTWQAWRKEALKTLKEWDKTYVKHEKTTNKELGAIQAEAFIPLTELWEANNNFYNINKMIADGIQVPDFRVRALEDQFILKLTKVCDILATFGQLKDKPYDIRQMLWVLKIENWREIKPFHFYLTPLLNALNAVIEELLRMRKAGILRSKYYIEHNEELQKRIITMVELDIVAQWLVGDVLKQNQLQFLYGVQNTLYQTAARTFMVDAGKNGMILTKVIPELCAYHTMKNILRIQRQKDDDAIKEVERQKRREILMAETGMTFTDEAEEEPKEEEKNPKKKGKKAKEVEIDPEELERRKAAAAKAKDIATYGRTWIWEDYHEEKDEIQQMWIKGSQDIARINDQVLEDIEDFIILGAFSDAKLTHAQIQKLIDENLEVQRNRARMYQAEAEANVVPDETQTAQKPVDIIEEGK